MFKDKKIKFKFESKYIDSVFVFEDGDFILFGVNASSCANNNNIKEEYNSIIFDGKTFEPKGGLEISSSSSYYNLKDNEFVLCQGYSSFIVYQFNSDRTSQKKIQNLNSGDFGTGRYLIQISNGDLCLLKMHTGYNGLYVYRKNPEVNEKFEPYGNTFLYQLEDINDIVDLNEKEVLGIQKKYGGIDSLVLNIIDTSNYKILRKNEIKYKDDSNNRLYISLPFHKWGENKLIGGGADSIFIFGLDTLELETTISFDKNIKNILVRPKGNIFLYLVADEKSKDMNLYKEANCYSLFYYLNEAKIDFKKNELKSYKEELINDYCKAHEDLFFIYNYVNNGLITLTDKTEIIIYDDFGDSNE